MNRGLLLRVNVWLLLALITLVPFLIDYAWKSPLAISYLNLFCAVLVGISLINIALGSLRLEPISSKSLIILIVLMVLMLAWGSLFSHPLRSILGPWTSRFLQPLVVGYLGYLLTKQGHLKLSSIAGALWASLALVAAHGLLQWGGFLPSNNISRLTGLYAFPNSFARYIEILLLLLFPYLLLAKSRFRVPQLIAWLAGLAVLLGTESYAGIGSFTVGLTLIILFLPKDFRKLKAILLVLITAALIIVSVYRQELPKYQATTTSSLDSRQQFWQIAWETVKRHPVTGIGLEGWERQYPELAKQYLAVAPIEAVSAQPHNIYLDATLRGGAIGLIAITYLLLWPVFITFRLVRGGLEKMGNGRWLILGVLGYGVAMLLFGLVDDPIFSDDTMLMLFIVYFALAVAQRPQLAQD